MKKEIIDTDGQNQDRDSSREKLQQKQKTISEIVEKFVFDNSEPVGSEEIERKIRELHKKSEELSGELLKKKSDRPEIYRKLIFNLNQIRDMQKNIIWSVSEDANSIIRDARNPVFPEKPEKRAKLGTSEAYKIQILNLARAAELMIASDESLEKKEDSIEIGGELEEYLGNPEKKLTDRDVKAFNGKLVAFVADRLQISSEEAGNRLNIAKEYTSFDDKHYSISTIYDLETDDKGKARFIETDIGLTEITREQISKFGGKNEEPGHDIRLENQKWFQDLDGFRQQMVRFQKEKIIDGQHVCPTQLRELPIIRNGYKKIVSKMNNSGKAEEIGVHIHTGTHYVDTKDNLERKILMQLIEEQQASYRGQGDMSVVCDLLSPNIFIPNDKKMSLALSEVNRQGGVHLNLSQNIARIISPRKVGGIDKIFNHILDSLKMKSKDDPMIPLVQYLRKGKTKDKDLLKPEKIRAKIEQLVSNAEEKRIFNIMADIRILINEPTVFDLKNKNLKIANKLEDLSNELKKLSESRKIIEKSRIGNIFGEDIPRFEIVIQCKSGKDRTGIVELYNVANDIIANLEVSGLGVNEVLGKMADLSNSVFLPGFQGGTPGCFGIKKEAGTVFPKSAPKTVKEMTMLATSKDNKFVYDKKQSQPEEKMTKNKSSLVVIGGAFAASTALLGYGSMSVLAAGASLFSVAALPIVVGVILMAFALSEFSLAKENYKMSKSLASEPKFDKNREHPEEKLFKEKIDEPRQSKNKTRSQISFSPSSSVTAHRDEVKPKGKHKQETRIE